MSETPPVSATVRCPGCGAEIAFRIGSSRILICEHCSFAVARTAGGFESIGHVADVIPSGTRLSLGTRGKYGEQGFALVGRIQLDWGQARWDEWYAAFDNGSWGWLAEAAGHYYISFRVDGVFVPQMAHPEKMTPGDELDLASHGRFVFSDRKRARYVAARGELPEAVPLDGTEYLSLDLSGAGAAFATLDYSDDPQRPSVFIGQEVSFESLRIETGAAQPVEVARQAAAALTCPNCHAPLTLQVPDQAKRVTCSHCNALINASQGTLQFLQLVKKSKFEWQLGSKCTFFGLEYIVVGWMQRGCTVEGKRYYWEEYLLYDPKNARYRFLVKSDHHWSFVTPISPGDVTTTPQGPSYHGKVFRRFSSVEATVEHVNGEFYWEVSEGEAATAIDYIAPPEGLSEERSADEVNWSQAVYVTTDDITAAFGGTHPVRKPEGVGAMQPNPVAYAEVRRIRNWSLLAVVGLFVFFQMYAGKETLFSSDLSAAAPERSPTAVVDAGPSPEVDNDDDGGAPDDDGGAADETAASDADQPDDEEIAAALSNILLDGGINPFADTTDAGSADDTAPYRSVVLVTEPFEIARAHRNLRVDFTSNVTNSWAGLEAMLLNQDTNEIYDVQLESSYYTDDDGTVQNEWDQKAYLSQVPAGTYVLRAELDWEKAQPRPMVTLKLTSGVPRLAHFAEAFIALLIIPVIASFRYRAFESSRWEDSTEDT